MFSIGFSDCILCMPVLCFKTDSVLCLSFYFVMVHLFPFEDSFDLGYLCNIGKVTECCIMEDMHVIAGKSITVKALTGSMLLTHLGL